MDVKEIQRDHGQLQNALPTHDEPDSPRNGPADGDIKKMREGGKSNGSD
jgi:hypothetical protein